jgi:hypothetical protein
MKKTIFWDIRPCSPLYVNGRFGGACRLNFQGEKINRARNNDLTRSKKSSCWFLAWLILRPWKWRRHVPPKRRLTFGGLHSVICYKIKLFIQMLYFRYQAVTGKNTKKYHTNEQLRPEESRGHNINLSLNFNLFSTTFFTLNLNFTDKCCEQYCIETYIGIKAWRWPCVGRNEWLNKDHKSAHHYKGQAHSQIQAFQPYATACYSMELRDLPHGDFGTHRMFKIDSCDFITVMQRSYVTVWW